MNYPLVLSECKNIMLSYKYMWYLHQIFCRGSRTLYCHD